MTCQGKPENEKPQDLVKVEVIKPRPRTISKNLSSLGAEACRKPNESRELCDHDMPPNRSLLIDDDFEPRWETMEASLDCWSGLSFDVESIWDWACWKLVRRDGDLVGFGLEIIWQALAGCLDIPYACVAFIRLWFVWLRTCMCCLHMLVVCMTAYVGEASGVCPALMHLFPSYACGLYNCVHGRIMTSTTLMVNFTSFENLLSLETFRIKRPICMQLHGFQNIDLWFLTFENILLIFFW